MYAIRISSTKVALIRTWEERTASEAVTGGERASLSPTAAKRRADGSVVAPSSSSKEFVAPAPSRVILIKYLIQFIAYLPERFPVNAPKPKDAAAATPSTPQPAEICRKAVQLLYDLLSPRLWNDIDLDLMLSKKIEEILLAEMKQDDKAEVFNTRMINTL